MLPLVSSITIDGDRLVLAVEDDQRLRLVVVEDLELSRVQIRDQTILRIEHRREERDDLRARSERRLLRRDGIATSTRSSTNADAAAMSAELCAKTPVHAHSLPQRLWRRSGLPGHARLDRSDITRVD